MSMQSSSVATAVTCSGSPLNAPCSNALFCTTFSHALHVGHFPGLAVQFEVFNTAALMLLAYVHACSCTCQPAGAAGPPAVVCFWHRRGWDKPVSERHTAAAHMRQLEFLLT